MQARLFADINSPNSFQHHVPNLLEDKIKGSLCCEPAFPHLFFNEETISLFVFGSPIVIEKKTGKVFFNGEEIFGFRHYLSPFEQDYNKSHRKTRLLELKRAGGAFVINKVPDGRLFFLFWNSAEHYRRFRCPPDWQASFWLHNGKAEWFETDLHSPKKVWC